MDQSFYRYWAKSVDDPSQYHLLAYHSLDVAAVGYEYLQQDTLLQKRLGDAFHIQGSDIPPLIGFLFALHDIGKFTESFQNKRPDLFFLLNKREGRLSCPLRHDSVGLLIWDRNIAEYTAKSGIIPISPTTNPVIGRMALRYLFHAVFGHHGRPPDMQALTNTSPKDVYTDDDVAAAKQFVTECGHLLLDDRTLSFDLSKEEIRKAILTFSWSIAGLAVLADWIGSNSLMFPFHPEEMPLEQYWNEIAIPQARHALSTFQIFPFSVSDKRGISNLFPSFQSEECIPSDLQAFVSDYSPGPGPHLFIIEESTGSGKTEAAITLAHQLMADGQGHGLYFALPTMATSNALYDRILKIKNNLFSPDAHPPIVLAHSARRLLGWHLADSDIPEGSGSEEIPADDLSYWLKDNKKKALLAPVGVGTIDQALVSILPRRHQSLRLFGLWRNILIVDEVHAYDPYVNALLRCLIQAHSQMGGSTILLSATLSEETRNTLIHAFCDGQGISHTASGLCPYPSLIHVSPEKEEIVSLSPRPGTSREVLLEFFYDEESVISALIDTTRKGRCACWIRNTVREAVEAYSLLKDTGNYQHLMLFHARFVLGDRLNREREVLDRFNKESTDEERASTLLIATQVVEQSLDLDFDFMVTDLAPIDLVIQRAGRLHRHPRGERGVPVLGIHAPEFLETAGKKWFEQKFPGAAHVYTSHGQVWLTLKVLLEKGRIKTPEDARSLIESVYGAGASELIPVGLLDRDRSDRSARVASGMAMVHMIAFSQGYQDSGNRWEDDEAIPTRLAEPSVTLRLGVLDPVEKEIRPIFPAENYSWDMSQVSISQTYLQGGIVFDEELGRIVDETNRTMHDRGRNVQLIPLLQVTDSSWENDFRRKDGTRVIISYSRDVGLIIRNK